MYYREYRTQFHIGITYGVSESRVCKIIKEIESILIKDSCFHYPKKALLKEAPEMFAFEKAEIEEHENYLMFFNLKKTMTRKIETGQNCPTKKICIENKYIVPRKIVKQ
ncbi:MAG: transposase family protein [Bacteroidales bacterium]|jgi:hypothetical protein|nr:transposase family protein [Bacteroidales bacterium]